MIMAVPIMPTAIDVFSGVINSIRRKVSLIIKNLLLRKFKMGYIDDL